MILTAVITAIVGERPTAQIILDMRRHVRHLLVELAHVEARNRWIELPRLARATLCNALVDPQRVRDLRTAAAWNFDAIYHRTNPFRSAS